MSLFWAIIAGMYGALAIVNNLSVRQQKRYLEAIKNQAQREAIITVRKGKVIKINTDEVRLKYFKRIGWVSFAGFLLAAFAASISSGFIKEISPILALILFYVIFSTLKRRGKMTKSQAKVLGVIFIVIAFLVLIAGLPITFGVMTGGVDFIDRNKELIMGFLILMALLGSAVILTGIGLFILKGKKKNNNDK